MPHLATRLETKFVSDASTGEFEGYASVFDHQDAHGDVVKPGAFADSLASLKANNRTLPMYANHGSALGGDPLPVGVWDDLAEDDHGLKVKGRIAAMDSDHGKRIYGLTKAGALSGLSIGYCVPQGGATPGTKAGEPKRTLHKLDLFEISLVDDPSNSRARVSNLKTAGMSAADRDSAAGSVAAAMRLHDKTMSSGGYYDGESRGKHNAILMDHLRDAHAALTGLRAPDGLEGWTKAFRDPDTRTALSDLRSGLAGFKLNF